MPAAYLLGPDMPMFQRCRKVPYASRREAIKAHRNFGNGAGRIDLVQAGAGTENFYRCGICGAWHFGHR